MSQLKPQEVVRLGDIQMANQFAICIIWRNERTRVKRFSF